MVQNAESLFTKVWFRTNKRFSSIFSFRLSTEKGMSTVVTWNHLEYSSFVKSIVQDPKYEGYFYDKEGFLKLVGGIDNFTNTLVNQEIESYQIAIDSSSIILAHSTLDAAAFDYLRVVELAASIQEFEKFVSRKQISLEDVKGSDYDDLLRIKIHDYIDEFERKSLLDKIDKLFQICQPPPMFSPIKDYVYNREMIQELDRLRNEIVHGDGLKSPLKICSDEIKYLMGTANFLMALVNERYNLKINPNAMIDSYH
jgi:hypothetical protein